MHTEVCALADMRMSIDKSMQGAAVQMALTERGTTVA